MVCLPIVFSISELFANCLVAIMASSLPIVCQLFEFYC